MMCPLRSLQRGWHFNPSRRPRAPPPKEKYPALWAEATARVFAAADRDAHGRLGPTDLAAFLAADHLSPYVVGPAGRFGRREGCWRPLAAARVARLGGSPPGWRGPLAHPAPPADGAWQLRPGQVALAESLCCTLCLGERRAGHAQPARCTLHALLRWRVGVSSAGGLGRTQALAAGHQACAAVLGSCAVMPGMPPAAPAEPCMGLPGRWMRQRARRWRRVPAAQMAP